MNKVRRNALEQIIVKLTECRTELENLKDEEQECFDNLPEALQDSEKGEAMQENADDLEDACDTIDCVMDTIEEVINR